ncbi:MAG TPA: PepSY domain-containing protein [Steroidobacteraceae bacterium]|nr:PepSY domain-containing protein [Steroidobacteraceae bacterium]
MTIVAYAAPFDRVPASTYQAGGMSLDQAIAMVQAKYGAKVMKADRVDDGGRTVYLIRLMTQDRSRVWTVRVDAATGREF